MGGTAIKHLIETRRYSVKEYEQLLPEVLKIASNIFPNLHPTTYFKSKDSFGDMDILCLLDSRGLDFDYNNIIRETFNSKGVSRNDNVISFEYKEFQIDFILTLEENWETSKIYYSYNDLSQYIGKIANQFGLKFAVQGLKYQQNGFDIIITKDHNKALEFLGFDTERYNKGFESMDEIYKYVISSKYFSPEFFKLENLSKGQRDRDGRRKNYIEFLKLFPSIEERKNVYFHSDKSVYLGLVDYFFPGFLQNINSILDKIKVEKELKARVNELYNGTLLQEKFNLSGLKLGYCMKKFRDFFGTKERMEKWILNNEQEFILESFKSINNL